ncbi:MAG TPA: hypothetical protein VFE33_16820 [Thermoanaerobaculia bacterium]|nr:hypothetical protein [Thermoanaerobaculia bacterium]
MRIKLPVLALLATVGLVACAGRARSPSEPEGGAIFFTTVVQTSVPGQSGGELRQVIRDAATWTRVWADLRAGSSLPATPPAVDFSFEMVIVAAMATQPCISQVTVRSINGDAGKTGNILADVLEEPPASTCHCITSQRAFHVVRLPRTDGSVQFTVTTAPRAC